MRVAVMGCEVNGPGEAAQADIGIAAGRGASLLVGKLVDWPTEPSAFAAIVAVAVVVLTILNLGVHDEILTSFRYSFFMVATTISSTGYGTDDYSVYSSTALTIVILLMFVGGCSGSTSGAIKIYPRRPTGEFQGFLAGSIGNYDYLDLEGALEDQPPRLLVDLGETVLQRRFGNPGLTGRCLSGDGQRCHQHSFVLRT